MTTISLSISCYRSHSSIRIVVIALHLFFTAVCSTSGQTLAEGNRAFSQGQYEEAISIFESLVNENTESIEIYYNTGRSYLEMERIGPALLNFHRALRLDPNNGKVLEAKEVAENKMTYRVTKIPDFFLLTWWITLVSTLGFTYWLLIEMLIGIITIYWLYRILFSTRTSTKFKLLGPVLFSLLLVSLMASISRYKIEKGGEHGIVMSTEVQLYEAPDNRSEEVTTIGEGVRVRVIERIGDWTKVLLADKDVGWLETKHYEII